MFQDRNNRPYAPWQPTPNQLSAQPAQAVVGVREGFLTESFIWMFAALLVSAFTAGLVLVNEGAMTRVFQNYFVLVMAELGLYFGIVFLINRINALVALGLLFVYAALNGLTLGAIAAIYATTTAGLSGVLAAFIGAAAIFGGAAVYGYATGRDLASFRGILFVGVLGIFVMSIVNIFIGGGTLSFVIGVAGVVIFTGLTAYYVQTLKNGALMGVNAREKAGVIGALLLYVLFINIFLMLLRIFGSGRR